MRKLFAVVALAVCLGPRPAFADPVVAAETPVTTAKTGVYYSFGPLNLTVPWDNPAATYLFDFQAKENLVGGEMPFAQIWNFGISAGAVTSLSGIGTPFFAVNLAVPNPAPSFAAIAAIHPGVFGGYNFNTGRPIFGFKASINIFS